jgi:multicomponent Na+:H+ antiporter subunit D
MILPIGLLALITIIIGLYTEPFFALADRAAHQLMNPSEYIHAVLGVE